MKRARGRNKKKTNYERVEVSESLTLNIPIQETKKPVKKKPKKKRTGLKFVLVIVILLVAAFFVFMGMGHGVVGNDGALIPVDMEKGKLNVLLLGVDESELRTDAMMIVSYDLNEASAEIMSIPRDTQIKVKDRKVTRKINEIHAMHDKNKDIYGPEGSIKVVTALTGIPIHYYIEFNFDAIDSITDVIGPIEFDVPDVEGKGRGMNYDDPGQDLHIHLKPGVQMLEGNQVQQFLRYRKSNLENGDGSDTSRVERQQEFIKAVIDQKVNLSLIVKLPSIYSAMKKNIKTNFTSSGILKFSRYLEGLTSEKIKTQNLPGESKRTSGGWYYICDFAATKELVFDSFDYAANDITNEITIDD